MDIPIAETLFFICSKLGWWREQAIGQRTNEIEFIAKRKKKKTKFVALSANEIIIIKRNIQNMRDWYLIYTHRDQLIHIICIHNIFEIIDAF